MTTEYTISEATDPLKIAERQYASAKKIMFTAFTSCIGVIAKKGATLTGVHLVITDEHGNIFDANDVPKVIQVLPEAYDAVTIFGCIDFWQSPDNGKVLVAAFQKLTGRFKTLKKYQQYTKKEGTYGAEIGDAGDIKINFVK